MVLRIKKIDYEFFYPLLDEEKQKVLASITVEQRDDVIIDDEDIEMDLYDWLNDLVVEKGFNENYGVNNLGERLEKISDYVFSMIEQ